MFEKIMGAAIYWLCALLFGGIAFWAFKRKEPIHLWSGSQAGPEEITDVRAYNRANGIMWAIYAACIFIVGIVSLFNSLLSAILLIIVFIPGIIVLVIVYNRIYNKYKNPSFTYQPDD